MDTHRSPYNLLSDDKILRFTVDGTSYKCINHYILRNFFKAQINADVIKKMYSNGDIEYIINKLVKEYDTDAFNRFVEKGTRTRYLNDKEFRENLKRLEGMRVNLFEMHECDDKFSMYFENFECKKMSVIERYSNVFNELEVNRKYKLLLLDLRSNQDNHFDETYGFVPKSEIYAVIRGLIFALKKNRDITDKNYGELREMFSNTPNSHYVPLLNELEKLDDLLVAVKIKYRDEIYKDDIEKFKDDLIDACLDDILETQHPHIARNQYRMAKMQQKMINREMFISLRERLFERYENGSLDKNILKRIVHVPKFPSSNHITESTIEKERTRLDAFDKLFDDIVRVRESPVIEKIDFRHFLSPYYPRSVKIDGIEYASVAYYAFSQLFQRLNVNIADLGDLDIVKIADIYLDTRDQKESERIQTLRREAIYAKFKTYSELKDLLILDLSNIKNHELYEELKPVSISNRIAPVSMRPYNKSVIAMDWFVSRVEAYRDVIRLFRFPDRQIISIACNASHTPGFRENDQETRNIMRRYLDDYEIDIVAPFIEYERSKLDNMWRFEGVKALIPMNHEITDISVRNKIAEERLKNKILDKVHSKLEQSHGTSINKSKYIRTISLFAFKIGWDILYDKGHHVDMYPPMNLMSFDRNFIVNEWFMYRIADYRDTMKLLIDPTLDMLNMIYGTDARYESSIDDGIIEMIKSSSVRDASKMDIIWSMIKTEIDNLNLSFDMYGLRCLLFHNLPKRNISKSYRDNVVDNLSIIYDKIDSINMRFTRDSFIKKILVRKENIFENKEGRYARWHSSNIFVRPIETMDVSSYDPDRTVYDPGSPSYNPYTPAYPR